MIHTTLFRGGMLSRVAREIVVSLARTSPMSLRMMVSETRASEAACRMAVDELLAASVLKMMQNSSREAAYALVPNDPDRLLDRLPEVFRVGEQRHGSKTWFVVLDAEDGSTRFAMRAGDVAALIRLHEDGRVVDVSNPRQSNSTFMAEK